MPSLSASCPGDELARRVQRGGEMLEEAWPYLQDVQAFIGRQLSWRLDMGNRAPARRKVHVAFPARYAVSQASVQMDRGIFHWFVYFRQNVIAVKESGGNWTIARSPLIVGAEMGLVTTRLG